MCRIFMVIGKFSVRGLSINFKGKLCHDFDCGHKVQVCVDFLMTGFRFFMQIKQILSLTCRNKLD